MVLSCICSLLGGKHVRLFIILCVKFSPAIQDINYAVPKKHGYWHLTRTKSSSDMGVIVPIPFWVNDNIILDLLLHSSYTVTRLYFLTAFLLDN